MCTKKLTEINFHLTKRKKKTVPPKAGVALLPPTRLSKRCKIIEDISSSFNRKHLVRDVYTPTLTLNLLCLIYKEGHAYDTISLCLLVPQHFKGPKQNDGFAWNY
jgi:hypothetical protein